MEKGLKPRAGAADWGVAVITLKVWQLMVMGLGVLVAAFALMTMMHGGNTSPSASSSQMLTPQEQIQTQQLVNAVPLALAFFHKHHGYAGLKLAPTTGVTVASASPTTYCLETNGPAPHVFKNGPAGQLMVGTCASPTAGTPVNG